MLEIAGIYALAKLAMAGIGWARMSSVRKNIASNMDTLKLKPTLRKRPRLAGLSSRYRISKIIAPCILIPGIGEVLFLAVTLGRYSNKKKIALLFDRNFQRMDQDNIKDALDRLGTSNLNAYTKLKKEVTYLSVQGHSEIAKQSVITLDNLLIDANLAGINLYKEPSIAEAIQDTAMLVGSLVKEEQSGIQSNIDTYLNVVESIHGDLIGKKAVFSEELLPGKSEASK